MRCFLKICVAVLLAAFVSGGALGQSKLSDVSKVLKRYSDQTAVLEKRYGNKGLDEAALIQLQTDVDGVLKGLGDFRKSLEPGIADLRNQLKELGPVPKKDEAPESDAVKKEREGLNKQLGKVDGADKKASLLQTRLNQLRRRVQDQRQRIFTQEVFHRFETPLGWSFWAKVADDWTVGKERLSEALSNPPAATLSVIEFLAVSFVVGLICFFLNSFCVRKINQLRTSQSDGQRITFFRRANSAILVSLLRLATPLVGCLLLYIGFRNAGAFSAGMDALAQTALQGALIFFVMSSFTKTILAVHRPEWRMFEISDEVSWTLYRYVQGMVFLFALNKFWAQLNEIAHAPLSIVAGHSFVVSLLFAGLLAGLALTAVRAGVKVADGVDHAALKPITVKLGLLLLAVVILAAGSLGYITFARFLTDQVVICGAVIVIGMLFHTAIGELADDIRDENTAVGGWFYQTLELDELRRKQTAFVIGMLLNLTLLMIVVPVILFQWGFSQGDISSWLSAAFFGVQIGSINLSLSTIIIALGLFSFGLVLTRFLQRWLATGPLTLSNLQDGVVDSVRTGVGYIGFALSVLIAISYAGVDFTNVAIVAGALSVGIGFGLQGIVNNFVSGLIMLVERPVKVGDWVVVGDQQGHVRRISVRSTEIETFDRSSVIIPNSDLISSTITNWTHSNSVGRIMIPVGVSYSEDARKVHKLLMEIGKSHPRCLTFPAPSVVFDDFGASSLDFTLRVFIANIRDALEVKTELRMAILEAFREHDIEIPFPQRDLHLRSSSITMKEITGERSE